MNKDVCSWVFSIHVMSQLLQNFKLFIYCIFSFQPFIWKNMLLCIFFFFEKRINQQVGMAKDNRTKKHTNNSKGHKHLYRLLQKESAQYHT